MLELWYDKPASIWEEALPLGNGRLGAMVWSGVTEERVSLNEDSLWSGYPCDHNVDGAEAYYKKARDLSLKGDYVGAQEMLEKHTLGHYTQCYLPMGELHLHFPQMGAVSGYRRSLNLETALSALRYTDGDVLYTRESFVSAEDQSFVMRISADQPGKVSFTAGFTCQLRAACAADAGRLRLEGLAPSEDRPSYLEEDDPIRYEEDPAKRGMRFLALADFEVTGGNQRFEGGEVVIEGADSVIIRLCARTSFNGPFQQPYLNGAPYTANCERDLTAALGRDYNALRARHLDDHGRLFGRVELSFGKGRDALPTSERLTMWESAEEDPSLFALLFQYGRYLLIAASRPGTLPTNLQGIWNKHLRAPWSSNYTVNINTEMNYWPTEAANLPECHEPLMDLLDALRVTGAKTARAHYGAGGFVVHHNTDIWGLSNPVGEGRAGTANYAFWPLSAGWLSAHAFLHYSYTLDRKFLEERAWPIIRDAARFFMDVMVTDRDGSLVFAPSTSPENRFLVDGKPCGVAKTTAMTVAIVKETLTNAARCCDILGVEPSFRDEAREKLEKLPPYQTGSRGEFLEWSEELPEAEPQHRHNSHLYALHPGYEITVENNPKLTDACRRTLALRGDESTGWSLAWRVNLWARLGNGEHAFTLLKKQVRPAVVDAMVLTSGGGCYPNLFGAHPPFQIDSNYGACAGIAELLLQSRDGEIRLLPALPAALGNGYVKGLRAWGGVSVDIEFSGGKMTKAALTLDARLAKYPVRVYIGGEVKEITLLPGVACIL